MTQVRGTSEPAREIKNVVTRTHFIQPESSETQPVPQRQEGRNVGVNTVRDDGSALRFHPITLQECMVSLQGCEERRKDLCYGP